MVQGRVDRKEGSTGRGKRAGKGWEWGGVLEAGRVDRKEGAGRGIWQRVGGQQEVGDGGGGKGEVEKNGKIRGDFTDGYDGMPGGQRLWHSLIATSTWNAFVE